MGTEMLHFSYIDYILFISTLLLSTLIGVYFGFISKNKQSPVEYLQGSRNMKIIPIAASLIASDISGITLMSISSQIYTNGISYSVNLISLLIAAVLIPTLVIPVYHQTEVNSDFEYLKIRYSNRISVLASITYTLQLIIYFPIVIYPPALAFQQVTGVQFSIIVPVLCGVCIFYTTVGGLKAVVWTDFLQLFIMVTSLITVFIIGVTREGNITNIYNVCKKGGRFNINWSFDPTDQTAIFPMILGLTVFWFVNTKNPIFIQRYISLPTARDAKIAFFIFCLGTIFFQIFIIFLGVIMYSHYADCDPFTAGYIENQDQILSYYIMDMSKSIPGLSGIFIAGLFSAALSTFSSALNTLAGTIYDIYIKPNLKRNLTDYQTSGIIKIVVLILGLVGMANIYLIQYLGTIMQILFTIGGTTIGGIGAIFLLGFTVPLINEKGAIYGCIGSVIIMAWIIGGAEFYKQTGYSKSYSLPTNITGCSNYLNITTPTTTQTNFDNDQEPFYLYRISMFFYGFVGFLIAVIIAIPVSLFTGGRKNKVNLNQLSPVIYPLLSKEYKQHNRNPEIYEDVNLLANNEK